MKSALVVLNALVMCATAHSQQYVIDTIAGGAPPFATPTSAATARIGFVRGIAADAVGNVYFPAYNSVFKIDQKGDLTRVAGTGRAGYSGDGGPATNAQLSDAVSIAVDGVGNLFIVDGARVRRVSPNGIIATVAGNGTTCFDPVNCLPANGVPATSTWLRFVGVNGIGLAVDSAGNLYLGEDPCLVRKIGADGIITIVAGGRCQDGPVPDGVPATSAVLASEPQALATDSAGNLYIAEGTRIRKVSPDGIITTFAGCDTICSSLDDSLGDGGPAIKAHLYAFGMVFDSAGNLLVADGRYNRVRTISPSGIITTIAGTGASGYSGDGGPATDAQLSCMRGLAVDGTGNLFIADSCNQRVRKVSLDGIITTVVGDGAQSFFSGDGGPATSALLNQPYDVAVDGSGNVFIADSGNSRVRKVTRDGTISTIAGNGSAPCSAYPPPGQSCPPNGDGGPAISAALDVLSVAVDGAGNVYTSGYDNRVRKVSPDGTINAFAGDGGKWNSSGDGGPATNAQFNGTVRVAADKDGDVFIMENSRVREVSKSGIIDTVAGVGPCDYYFAARGCPGPLGDGGPAKNAQLDFSFDDCGDPAGALALDDAGDLFIADSFDRRVREVTAANGIINTVAGKGQCDYYTPGDCALGDGGPATKAFLPSPIGVAVDNAGNLFISDGYSHIRKVTPDGTISTVAGNGSYGYSGDGGAAISASLGAPWGIAVDGAGNIYVADTGSNAVRVLRPAKTSVLVTAVVDAASQRADPISPGKMVVLYGAGLGPAKVVTGSNTGTAVTFNGAFAQILYSSATQVAVVVPASITGTTAQVAVNYQGVLSDPVFVPVAPSSPGLFTLDQTGAGQAAAVNDDGSVNTAAKPIRIGGYISLYATGWSDAKLPVSVTIDGIQAPVQFAGQAPGQPPGLIQVNVQIPSGVKPGGYVPVVLRVGDVSTTDGAAWIAVSGN